MQEFIYKSFNSQKCSIYNLSLQYPYITQQTDDENYQTCQAQVVTLIDHQILVNHLQRKV